MPLERRAVALQFSSQSKFIRGFVTALVDDAGPARQRYAYREVCTRLSLGGEQATHRTK